MAKTPEAGSNACTERVTPTRTSEELAVCHQLAGAAAVFPGNWKAAAAVGSIRMRNNPNGGTPIQTILQIEETFKTSSNIFAAMREGITS